MPSVWRCPCERSWDQAHDDEPLAAPRTGPRRERVPQQHGVGRSPRCRRTPRTHRDSPLGRQSWMVRGRTEIYSTSQMVIPLGAPDYLNLSLHAHYPDVTVVTIGAGG